MLEEYEVQAINRTLGKVITAKNEICDIQGWHNEDDDSSDPADATFVTFQFPDGKWGFAVLSEFNFNNGAH